MFLIKIWSSHWECSACRVPTRRRQWISSTDFHYTEVTSYKSVTSQDIGDLKYTLKYLTVSCYRIFHQFLKPRINLWKVFKKIANFQYFFVFGEKLNFFSWLKIWARQSANVLDPMTIYRTGLFKTVHEAVNSLAIIKFGELLYRIFPEFLIAFSTSSRSSGRFKSVFSTSV